MPFEAAKNIAVWFTKPFRPQTKQYWRVVLLCFVAASTFWLLNALNKSYSTQTTYPVKFIYNEQKLVPVKALPEEVVVNVTAKGWKLLRKALHLEVQPAEVYIRNLPRNNYLLGSALRPALVNAMDGLQLNFVVTDTLYFDFDISISRAVPLQLDPRQKVTAEGYAISGPVRLSPDSVTFSGPSSLVNSIPSPYLVRLENTGLTSSAKHEVPVIYTKEKRVKTSIAATEVSVTVKSLVQEERQLQLQLENIPKGKKVVLTPQTVIVRYQLFKDSVALLNREAFKAVLNFAKYNPQDSTIAPELIQKPVGVRQVILVPQRLKAVLQD